MKKNKEHIVDLIPEYLDGLLKKNQREKVEAHLKMCNRCAEELAKMKELFHAFDKEQVAQPSSKLKMDFLAQLEEEKKAIPKVLSLNSRRTSKENIWRIHFFRTAASIALLIGAFFLGKYQTETKADEKIATLTEEKTKIRQTAMLALMENQSASKRIKGMGFIDGFTNPDDAIVMALIDRMYRDDNANVRLTALEALSKFTDSEMVKEAFIRALSAEKNPSIQIALIQILVEIQEKKAAGPMKRLLEKEDTQPFIKDEIKEVLPEII